MYGVIDSALGDRFAIRSSKTGGAAGRVVFPCCGYEVTVRRCVENGDREIDDPTDRAILLTLSNRLDLHQNYGPYQPRAAAPLHAHGRTCRWVRRRIRINRSE